MDPHLHYNAIGMNSFRKAWRLEQAAIAVANMSEHLRAKPRMDGILFKLLVRIRFLISKFSGKYKISGYPNHGPTRAEIGVQVYDWKISGGTRIA